MDPALQKYLRDASQLTGEAKRILFPSDESEIAQLLREANQTRVPLTLSGGGTGLTGGRVPHGGTLLCTDKLNKILTLSWDKSGKKGFVVVQPGVTLKALEEALDPLGLFYPPNPGEKAAFLGGTIATNASGARSFKYGPTRSYVRRLRVVLPSGELLECRRGSIKESGGFLKASPAGGKTLRIPIPTYSVPRVKNAAGYYAAPDMDLVDLFIGSEGTLGAFSEVELEIREKPTSVLSGILFFPSEKSCFRFAMEAKSLGPRVLEFFDSRSLAFLSSKQARIPSTAGAALFFEQELAEGETCGIEQEWIRQAKRFDLLAENPWISASPKEQQAFRDFRYDLPVMVNQQISAHGFHKIGTDMAVPDASAERMLDFYLEQLPKSGIPFCLFGHIGDNHLHANLLPKNQEQFDQAKAIYEILARKAIELGGTVSAEHGIGKLRIPYLKMMVGESGLREMARVKQALDPNGILNPGTLIPLSSLRGPAGAEVTSV